MQRKHSIATWPSLKGIKSRFKIYCFKYQSQKPQREWYGKKTSSTQGNNYTNGVKSLLSHNKFENHNPKSSVQLTLIHKLKLAGNILKKKTLVSTKSKLKLLDILELEEL